MPDLERQQGDWGALSLPAMGGRVLLREAYEAGASFPDSSKFLRTERDLTVVSTYVGLG